VWSTIPPIWRKRTITSHLIIVLNTKKKTTTYDVGNSDLGLENAKYGEVQLVNGKKFNIISKCLPTMSDCIF
jgi:hypothetical protein